MTNALARKLRSVSGRSETGPWIQVTEADPRSGAVELVLLLEQGGRFNPPGSFPVTYLAEGTDAGRETMSRFMVQETNDETRFVLLHIETHLTKILDLSEASVRQRLGFCLSSLSRGPDFSRSRSIGQAAHDAGFEGILYPRPLGRGARNLAIFCDRAGNREVNIVGAVGLNP